jgi:hypothetical protein
MEIPEVRVCFQESILHCILGIFVVPGDISSEAKDPGLVTTYELFEGRAIACPGSRDKQVLVIANDG